MRGASSPLTFPTPASTHRDVFSSKRAAGVTSSFIAFALGSAAVAVGCSSDPSPSSTPDPGPIISLGDAAYGDAPAANGNKKPVEAGFTALDGAVIRADRFVTNVLSFTPGDCAGYGIPQMPGIVTGPPLGGGCCSGSLDVVSLGHLGEIVVGFEPNAIVDGPGVDFIVFGNPFWIAGDSNRPYAKLGEVSVSDDGVTWKTFSCTPGPGPNYGACAGWRPVFSAPGNGISAVDPAVAGGDGFDLADLGQARARFVRIRDLGTVACPADPAMKLTSGGFNLDAIAIVNPTTP